MADGRILIDTKIDATGIIDGTDKIIAAARRMAKDVNNLSTSVRTSFSRQADAIQKASRVYLEQSEKVEGLRRKLEELKAQQIPTEGYKNLEAEIKKNESALDKLIEKQKRFTETGGNAYTLTSEYKSASKEVERLEGQLNRLLEKQNKWDVVGAPSARSYKMLEFDIQSVSEKLQVAKEKKDALEASAKQKSSAFQKMEYDIDQTRQKLDELRAKKEAMEAGGTAYISGENTDEAAAAAERLAHEQQRLEEMGRSLTTSYDALEAKINEYGGALNSASQAQSEEASMAQSTAENVNNLAEAESHAANEGERLSSAENSVGNEANNAKGYVGALEASLNGLRSIPGTLAKLPGAVFGSLVSGLKSISVSAASAAGSMANLASRGVTSGLSKVSNNLNKVHTSAEKSSKSTGKLGHSLMTIIKYSLGIRSLYVLVNKLRRGLIEGMKNLAQYSSETNTALSGLKSSTTQLKNAFATAFAPILTAVAPALIYLINLASAAATAVSRLAAILTGKNTFVRAKKVQQDYAASLKGTGSAAKEAGEDAEGSLASFDKLNVMAEESAGGGSGGGGGGAGDLSPADMFETVPIENSFTKAIEAAKKRLLELKDLFMKGFFDGAKDLSAIDRIKENLKGIGQTLIEIFSDGSVSEAFNNMLDTLVYNLGRRKGAMFSVGLTLMENLTGGLRKYLEENKESIREWLITMFDITASIDTIVTDFLVAFAYILTAFRTKAAQDLTASLIEIFASSFMGVVELGAKFGRDLIDAILTPITENAPSIRTVLVNTITPISTVIETISKTVKKSWDEINKMYDEHIKPLFDSLKDGLTEIVREITNGYNVHIAPVLDRLAEKFKNVWEITIEPMIMNAIGLIGDIIDLVKVLWEHVIQPFLEWCVQTFYPSISPIVEGLGNLFLSTFDAIGLAVDKLIDIFRALIQFLTEGFTDGWGKAWDNLKNKFQTIFESLPGITKTVMNKVISGIEEMLNGAMEGISGFVESVNGVLSVIPGASINIPSASPVRLPRLASGTVVPPRAGEFAAILGDNNREAEVVSPLSTIKQALVEALAQSGGMGGGDITAHIYLDGRELGRSTVKFVREEKNRTGVNPLLV